MHPLIVIPARHASTRLPGKMLADLGGAPMVVRVWERATLSGVGRVVIATDHADILSACHAAGAEAVMTHDHHPSGSDRVWEALSALDPAHAHDVVINLQGDVPTIPPTMLADVLAPLKADPAADLATLCAEIGDPAALAEPAIVKPVVAWDDETPVPGSLGRALYFTRHPAPWGDGPHYHHIGLYAWRRSALERFVHLPPSPLEKRERLEQLRALEHGLRIGIALAAEEPPGIDTPEQLAALQGRF